MSNNTLSDFQPTFEQAAVHGPYGGEQLLNSDYFATQETAEWIMKRFGAVAVFFKPYEGTGGGYTAPQERWLRFSDGTEMNAGNLAAYFVRNPEKDFPGLAEKFVWALVHGAQDYRRLHPND